MTSIGLLACRNPRQPIWEIGVAPSAYPYTALVGWTVRPAPIDSGVPPQAAGILARSMTAVSRITFAASELNVDYENEERRRDRDGEAMRLVARNGTTWLHKLLHRSENLYLISTLDPGLVVRLFDDGGCPWWLQRQFILFSSHIDPPLDVARDQVMVLLGEQWPALSTSLLDAGVVAVGRPGVDGDVLAIFSSSRAFVDSFLAALERYADAVQAGFQTVSESDFVSRL